jgi:flagellar hook-associated protein 1 FlgK
MSDVFSTGVTGLGAAQTALSTIAQNVANVNTPGYARQTISLTTQEATKSGAGYIGGGVLVSGIDALVDPFLERALTLATGNAAGSQQSASLFDQMQSILSDSSSGLSAGVASFQSALGQAAANPSSVPARQLVLTNASALASSLNSVASSLQAQKQSATQSLSSQVATANSILQQIAKLNDSIAKAEPRSSSGAVLSGQQANDLRAQRQLLVNKLSGFANVSTYEQNEGLTVTLGGAAVVVANRASALSTAQDPSDPTKLTVGVATLSGQVVISANSLGGQLGATLNFIDHGADQALAQLNHFAGALAHAVNDQSAKGVDLYGNAGNAVFSISPPSVAGSSKNTGSLALSAVVDPYASQPSNYKLAYSTAGGYALTRLSDNTLVASGASLPLLADGITLTGSSGAIASGDSYIIKPFGSQASSIALKLTDPKQLALANPVATAAATTNTSAAKISAPTVVSSLPLDPNLTSPVRIVFTSPSAYTISGPGIGTLTNQPYTAGAAISYNGWSVNINGLPVAGDAFSVNKSVGAVADASNGNALSKLLQGKSFDNSSESLADLYANIQSDLGNKTALAHTNSISDASVLSIATSQRESYSGVNLDQEAADLARWQQIYSANAQVMSVAQKLFEALLNQI